MCALSYIALMAAKMEFSGRGHECLGRVKGTIENKIVAITARNCAVPTAAAGPTAWLPRPNALSFHASTSGRVNVCGRLSASSHFVFVVEQGIASA
jgi:hypothetical protein